MIIWTYLCRIWYTATSLSRSPYLKDLADIYQDIKDFIFVFQLGLNETMNDSLAICQENFGMLWGQKLVNTLRALHDVKYNLQDNEEEEENNEEGFYEPSEDDSCCEEGGCHCHDDECHCHEAVAIVTMMKNKNDCKKNH